MSTNSDESQGTPAPEHDFDELTGVYGFFRRHQKKLLYTAGLFTLLTFSITGSVNSLVEGIFSKEQERATIVVNGKRTKLTNEDYRYGALLARHIGNMPRGVMLQVLAGEGGDTELSEVFAIMRRAAIGEGIEPSLHEVDRAIETAREQQKAESAAKLAVSRGFASLAEYRALVAEAMRVGTYSRLQLMAIDNSDAEVMRQLLLNEEKVAFMVATFDEKAYQEELKAKSELTDDDLKTWLDTQSDMQKSRMSAFDLPRVKLRFAALLWAEGQFQPEQWADTVLKDYEITDDQLKTYYEADKEFFKVADKDEYREFEDEAVKAQLTRIVQAERVMIDLNTKLVAAQLAVVKPKSDMVADAQSQLNEAQQTFQAASKAKVVKEREIAAKEADSANAPENEDLKASVVAMKAELEPLATAAAEAELVVTALKTGLETAQQEEEAARSGFDFFAEFDKLVEGKSGFVHKELDKMVTAEDLKDLDALGLELGHWESSMTATTLRSVGQISNNPSRSYSASLIYQALEMEAQPLKPWDVLKPLLQDAYWSEKAVAAGRDKSKAMADTLLRLAKEKMPEFVAELEKDRQSRIDTKVAEWEAGVNADIAEASEMLKKPNLGTKPRTAWQQKLDNKQRELGVKESRVTMFASQVDREILNETKKEATKHFPEVLGAAAAEVGYTVREFGPYPRNLTQRPRFDKIYDKTVSYTFLQHNEMKVGDAVGPVTDQAERRSHVIVCKSVEPLTVDDVTRREFEMKRKYFSRYQQGNGQSQAFTKAALEARFQMERPVGELVDER